MQLPASPSSSPSQTQTSTPLVVPPSLRHFLRVIASNALPSTPTQPASHLQPRSQSSSSHAARIYTNGTSTTHSEPVMLDLTVENVCTTSALGSKQSLKPATSASSPSASGTVPARKADAPVNVATALQYLDSVKAQFKDRPEVYSQFLNIMKDFKSQTIDTRGVMDRVVALFHGKADLMQGFNTFLPDNFHLECSTESGSIVITIITPTDRATVIQ